MATMVIVRGNLFEQSTEPEERKLGEVLTWTKYRSTQPRLKTTAARRENVFLVTVRYIDTQERLWLVAEYPSIEWDDEDETFYATGPNELPITDITHLRSLLRFDNGKGLIQEPGLLGQSLQTPRFLTAHDVLLIRQAVADANPSAGREDMNGDEVQPPHLPETVLRAIKERRGQAAFRARLLVAYGGRCAMTGCNAEPALEAAHILEYSATSSQEVTNGLLLRANVHTLFDLQLIQIEPEELRIHLDDCLQESSYARLHARKLRLPERPMDRPSKDALRNRWERAKSSGAHR